MFQLFMLLAARWYASNYLVLDMSVASVVVRSLNKCPQNWLSTRKISFHDTFMIFIIITINNVMIIITLCPEATSSCNRCFFNVRCPCQPPHRTGTSGTRLPHRHQATWHVPGPGNTFLGHVACAGRGVTGLDWVLLCSVVFRADSSVAAPHQCGWHAASAASAQLAGPTSNIWRAPAFIPSLPGCEYAGPVSTSPATLMSLWPVLASLSLFN